MHTGEEHMLPRYAEIMGSAYEVRCTLSSAASAHWFGGIPREKWYFNGEKKDQCAWCNIQKGWAYVASLSMGVYWV